jgi:hypothetical protein
MGLGRFLLDFVGFNIFILQSKFDLVEIFFVSIQQLSFIVVTDNCLFAFKSFDNFVQFKHT